MVVNFTSEDLNQTIAAGPKRHIITSQPIQVDPLKHVRRHAAPIGSVCVCFDIVSENSLYVLHVRTFVASSSFYA